MAKSFPKNWPRCCPPGDAADANATVYRVVQFDPPSKDCFASAEEKGTFLDKDPCVRVSISVNSELRDAMHQRMMYPKLGMYIAKANLAPTHGKIKATPSRRNKSHMEWWKYDDVDCSEIFECVDDHG